MTAVVDTNVLASGIVGASNPASTPGQIVRSWQRGGFMLVISETIFDEVVRTLEKPYFQRRLTSQQVSRAQLLLRRRATLTSITDDIHGVATHPEDDVVLATAVSGSADYLVTGDEQLQKLLTYRGVQILSPRAFLDLLQSQGAE